MLSASIFNIVGGEPLLPLQTLWVSFTTLSSIQSVGLGYSGPAAGLIDRPPRPPGRPILTRALIVWLAFVGLLTAIGTAHHAVRGARPARAVRNGHTQGPKVTKTWALLPRSFLPPVWAAATPRLMPVAPPAAASH